MTYLIDTTILGRLANARDTQHIVAAKAVLELHRRGELLHVTPQVMIEFRNVATRPAVVNGLGLSTVDTEALAATYVARFPLVGETPDIYPAWKALVESLGVIGKQVHDARLVAVCHVHALTHVLTFNVSHFTRLAGCSPGVAVVDPARMMEEAPKVSWQMQRLLQRHGASARVRRVRRNESTDLVFLPLVTKSYCATKFA